MDKIILTIPLFHRVGGEMNLAMRFNARLTTASFRVASATIENDRLRSAVAGATQIVCPAVRALKRPANIKHR